MSYSITIKIPGLPKSTNGLVSTHWRTKGGLARQWILAVTSAVGVRRPDRPLLKARVACTRVSSSCPDYDGLVSSFKHPIDGLVRCGVLADDSMDHVGMPEFKWQKGKKGEGYIVMTVTEIRDPNQPPEDEL